MGDICKYNNFFRLFATQFLQTNIAQSKKKEKEKKPPTALIHSVLERSQKWIRDIHEK